MGHCTNIDSSVPVVTTGTLTDELILLPDTFMNVTREHHSPLTMHGAVPELADIHGAVGENQDAVAVETPIPELTDVGDSEHRPPGSETVGGHTPELTNIATLAVDLNGAVPGENGVVGDDASENNHHDEAHEYGSLVAHCLTPLFRMHAVLAPILE